MITDPPPESDSSAGDVPGSRPASFDPFAPVALVAVSVLIFLWHNASSIGSQKSQLRAALAQRESEANQATRSQAELQKLATEILQLAKSEPQLAGLIEKYQIRQSAP